MSTVKHSMIDRFVFDMKLDNDTILKKNVQYSNGSVEDYNDLFQTFLQKKVEFDEKPSEVMKGIVESLQDMTEFKNLKATTTNDPLRSWFGMTKFSEQLENTLSEFKELNDLKNRENRAKEVGDTVAQDLIGKEIKKYFLKNKNAVRCQMRQDVKKAQEEVDNVDTVMGLINGSGCDDSVGSGNKVDADWVIPMLKDILNNKYVMQALEFAGRLTHKAESICSANPSRKVGSLIGVTCGDELESLLPKEYAMADDPDLESLFWLNYCQKTLQVFDRESEDPKAEGEIVLCLDKSGSMGGEKYKLASGLVFAYWKVANIKKRPFYVIGYDEDIQDSFEVKSVEDVLKFLKNFSGGGTNFDKPLNEACRIIGDNPKFENADIVFVTDGCSTVMPATLERIQSIKSKIGLKILGLSIRDYYGEATLKTFCDKTWKFDNVTSQAAEDFYKEGFSI